MNTSASDVAEKRSPRYLIRRLLPYAWRRRGPLALVAAGMAFDIGFALLQPWPLKVLVDNVLRGRHLHGFVLSLFQALPGPHTRDSLLTWTIAATVVIFLLAWAAGLVASWAAIRFGSRMSYDVAADLFAHLQRLSLRYHARHGIGSSIRRITSDSEAVATIIQDGGLPAISSVATLVAMLVVMLELDVELTLVALAVIPPMALIVRRYSGPMTERSYAQQEAEGELYETLEQTLTGIAVVQAFGGESAADARLKANTDRIMRATIRMTWAQSRFSLLLGAVTALGTAAVVWIGADQALAGTLSLGTILVFISYLGSLYSPVHDVSYSSGTISESLGSALRVVEVLDAPADVEDRSGAVRLPGVRGEVAVEGVTFGYEAGRPVLHEVSFAASPGEVVAVVGPTGAGKTTLVGLLPRFFDPDQGRVLLDGRDLRDLRLRQVRGGVSLVLQESFLFPFSIAENIAYGRVGASREEIVEAARAANADEFVSRLPDGYDTVVGERGATLSVGERQRVAIARALLKDAPVLILDEPTSALDAETERSLLQALDRLMAGRTTVIIAHRLSTIRKADQILVLREGRIVERGHHQQLIDLNGHYARMHDIQHGTTPTQSP
jgi:ATP-binding cassette subfamily B protein/subfamily B ATP-binding cassette protein MsbA